MWSRHKGDTPVEILGCVLFEDFIYLTLVIHWILMWWLVYFELYDEYV